MARTVGRRDYYPLRGGARFRRAGQQVQTGSHPSATQGHLQFSREVVFVELLYQFTAGRLAILSRLPAPATDFEPIGACSLLSPALHSERITSVCSCRHTPGHSMGRSAHGGTESR